MLPTCSAGAAGGADIEDSSSSPLLWPAFNLYPSVQNRGDGQTCRGPGARRGHRAQAAGVGQMVQLWEALASDLRLLRGGQVG